MMTRALSLPLIHHRKTSTMSRVETLKTEIDQCVSLLQRRHADKTQLEKHEIEKLFNLVQRLCEVRVTGVYAINHELYDVTFNGKYNENSYKKLATMIIDFCIGNNLHEIPAVKASERLRSYKRR